MTEAAPAPETSASLRRRRAPSRMGIDFDLNAVAGAPPAGFSDRQFPQLAQAAPAREAAAGIEAQSASGDAIASPSLAPPQPAPRDAKSERHRIAGEKVFFGIRMSRDLRERLQIYAIRHRTSAQDLVVGFVEKLLDGEGDEPAASRGN